MEVIWQSSETTDSGDPYITVKKARNYYYYAERGGVNSIAFILRDGDDYGLIKESKPPFDSDYHMVDEISAFGGSIDKDMSYLDICIEEVFEESGYTVTKEDIQCIGDTIVSTQMNQKCTGYIVDVTGKDSNEQIEDNTKVVWGSYNDIMEHGEWKSVWILSRYMYYKRRSDEYNNNVG